MRYMIQAGATGDPNTERRLDGLTSASSVILYWYLITLNLKSNPKHNAYLVLSGGVQQRLKSNTIIAEFQAVCRCPVRSINT